MATQWEDPIRNTKTLSVFAGKSVTGGVWASVFANALSEFNRLASTNKIGLKLVQSSTAPDPSGIGGADVQFEAGNGIVKFTSFGQPVSVTVNGNALGGDTRQVITVVQGVQRVAKAFVVVPATPQIDAIPPRAAGAGVLLFIAVHELLHAAGLSNGDHNPSDVFAGSPQSRAGSTPADDKLEVNGPKRLPPLLLAAATIARMTTLWP